MTIKDLYDWMQRYRRLLNRQKQLTVKVEAFKALVAHSGMDCDRELVSIYQGRLNAVNREIEKVGEQRITV